MDVDEMEIGKVDPSVTMEDMHTSMISSATAELGTFGTAELGSFGTAETSLSEAAKPTVSVCQVVEVQSGTGCSHLGQVSRKPYSNAIRLHTCVYTHGT